MDGSRENCAGFTWASRPLQPSVSSACRMRIRSLLAVAFHLMLLFLHSLLSSHLHNNKPGTLCLLLRNLFGFNSLGELQDAQDQSGWWKAVSAVLHVWASCPWHKPLLRDACPGQGQQECMISPTHFCAERKVGDGYIINHDVELGSTLHQLGAHSSGNLKPGTFGRDVVGPEHSLHLASTCRQDEFCTLSRIVSSCSAAYCATTALRTSFPMEGSTRSSQSMPRFCTNAKLKHRVRWCTTIQEGVFQSSQKTSTKSGTVSVLQASAP